MAIIKRKKGVNLVPKDKFAETIFGRTLNWLLSTFRVIVVLVELLVMAAFLSRFWLDARNSDYDDELLERAEVIASTQNLEEGYRLAQEKIKLITKISPANRPQTSLVERITSLTPTEITLKKISVSLSEAEITGSSLNEAAIAQLMTNLKKNDISEEIFLISLSVNKETSLLDFSLGLGKRKNE